MVPPTGDHTHVVARGELYKRGQTKHIDDLPVFEISNLESSKKENFLRRPLQRASEAENDKPLTGTKDAPSFKLPNALYNGPLLVRKKPGILGTEHLPFFGLKKFPKINISIFRKMSN